MINEETNKPAVTNTTAGITPINKPTAIPTNNTTTQPLSGTTGQIDTGDNLLNDELKKIQDEKNNALLEQKKQYALGKASFEKNKSYISNYDQVNNLYE